MAPRIIVQTGSNDLHDLGDLAMLEVLLERVRVRQRGARFAVISRNADRIESLGADVEQIPVEQKREWAALRAAYLRTSAFVPVVDRVFRAQFQSLHVSLLRSKARALVNKEALNGADALLVCGGGFITDVFPGNAWPVMERLDFAATARVPFALMGQGIGPLRDKALLTRARAVLPHAKLIAVRESLHSLPLLLDLGVPEERIVVTGDDAIEPAYHARQPGIGTSIGIDVRVAEYSGITRAEAERIALLVRIMAIELAADVIALPVSLSDSAEGSSDANLISMEVESGRQTASPGIPATTSLLIERFSACRVVITGSYHAAVFALAQGIPAVCVFNSEYYESKFRGLASQFGTGCQVISNDRPDFVTVLRATIERAWDRAASLRPSLLRAAWSQIKAGHSAYDRLSGILDAEASRHALIP